ncbi:MAG: hypothetical protein DRJ38_07085 [Thermoprotei archaeon]|nr:MAG: hypothetical protein DRJ38_07085 [Thermoprotei archaeon]
MDTLREISKYIKKIVSENSFIAGIVLFGSIAREEKHEKSDIDLLILWDNLYVDPDERYVYIYKVVSKYFPPSTSLTILDMKYDDFLKVEKATPLFLNIVYDGIVLFDKYGKLKNFILKVKKELEKMGVKREKIGKYYYWKLPKAGSKVELKV